MKIVIPGGSGQVGTVLARAFHAAGHHVVVLSRRPDTQRWPVVAWDGVTPGGWARELDGCDVVINMAGRSVNCRYRARNRREILDSRVLSTRAVGQAITCSYGTLNPGALARIEVRAPDGTWDAVWICEERREVSPFWSEPRILPTMYASNAIRLVLDTDRVPGWNEIDAVEMLGDGIRQWAVRASASSSTNRVNSGVSPVSVAYCCQSATFSLLPAYRPSP